MSQAIILIVAGIYGLAWLVVAVMVLLAPDRSDLHGGPDGN